MCIAIYKPKDVTISKAALQRCFKANPDGAGFMFAEDNQLHTYKGYFSFKNFYKAYQKHETKQALVHFRIKTHGKTNKQNCHPFLVNDRLGFIHNGIINGYGNDRLSDTIQFNNAILKKIVKKHGSMGLFDDPMQELIENVIGYSKLVFLDNKGNFNIMNEEKGHWHNKVWYSNDSYCVPKPYVPAVTYPSTWGRKDDWNRQDTPEPASAGRSSLAVNDWVELKRDYTIGTGDDTHIIKKGDWLEVQSIQDDGTCTLLDDDLKLPMVYPGVKCTDVESYDNDKNIQEVTDFNKNYGFDY